MEESHNGIAAVLKTADRKVVGVRVSLPPHHSFTRSSMVEHSAVNRMDVGSNPTA